MSAALPPIRANPVPLLMLAPLLFVLPALLPAPPARTLGGGTFPGEPFNGLQVEYTVSGAELGPGQDEPGFTWYRQQDGRLTGQRLVVSGTAHATRGWGADIAVRLSASGVAPAEFTFRKYPPHGLYPDPMHKPFSVAIDVPAGAETADFSIDLTGTYQCRHPQCCCGRAPGSQLQRPPDRHADPDTETAGC